MLDKTHDIVEVEDALVAPTHRALDKYGWRSFIVGVFHKLAKQTLLFCIFIFLCALGLNLYRLGTPRADCRNVTHWTRSTAARRACIRSVERYA